MNRNNWISYPSSMTQLTLELDEHPQLEDFRFILDAVRGFNRAQTGNESPRQVAYFLRDDLSAKKGWLAPALIEQVAPMKSGGKPPFPTLRVLRYSSLTGGSFANPSHVVKNRQRGAFKDSSLLFFGHLKIFN